MDSVNYPPVVMLIIFGSLIACGGGLLGWAFALRRRQRRDNQHESLLLSLFPVPVKVSQRPTCWIAIRSVSPEAVQHALGLNHIQPCSWSSGLSGDHGFFISPRIHGWVIVTGTALPTPTDDVDATFIFLAALSRRLGHVQYFYASRLLHHHAWARLDDGCVTRAYAWTGETVWNQGPITLPETETGVRTFAYGDTAATILDAEVNFEKVSALAARWSLDPAEIKLNSLRQSIGIAGESAFI